MILKETQMFTQIPAWTFENTSKDWYSLAAALVLAGLWFGRAL
jgi:hypothetical protein